MSWLEEHVNKIRQEQREKQAAEERARLEAQREAMQRQKKEAEQRRILEQKRAENKHEAERRFRNYVDMQWLQDVRDKYWHVGVINITGPVEKDGYELAITAMLMYEFSDLLVEGRDRWDHSRAADGYGSTIIDSWWEVDGKTFTNNTSISITYSFKRNYRDSHDKGKDTIELVSNYKQGFSGTVEVRTGWGTLYLPFSNATVSHSKTITCEKEIRQVREDIQRFLALDCHLRDEKEAFPLQLQQQAANRIGLYQNYVTQRREYYEQTRPKSWIDRLFGKR